jgi:hypothetical protein
MAGRRLSRALSAAATAASIAVSTAPSYPTRRITTAAQERSHMHEKVAQKVAETALTNVAVLLSHALEEAEKAYNHAPRGSERRNVARASIENLCEVVSMIGTHLTQEYAKQNP